MGATMELWARGLAEEAYVQGFRDGQERGHRETVEHGRRGFRLLRNKEIRENEYPFAPIAGHELDGSEDIEDWETVEGRTESDSGAGNDPEPPPAST